MGYIYKITNKINKKIYIGKTVNTIEHRWKDHINDCNGNNIKAKNYLLHKAIKKYGVDNFIIEQLEECDNNLLDEKEKYWIKIFNSYYITGYGYNMTYGGEGTIRYSDEDILILWNQGLKSCQIAQQLGADKNTISNRLKGLLPSNAARKRHVDANKRSIIQYDLNGNFIKQWNSVLEAEQTLKISSGCISKCCKKERTFAKDSLWKYSDDSTPIEELMLNYAQSVQCRQVNMYDKQGNFIRTYESGRQAELDNNISRGNISAVCNHIKKTAGGYKWEWSYPLKRQLIELKVNNEY